MSKSELIRQILDQDPEMKPAAIRAALGGKVEINLIKVVRHHWRKKRAARERMKAREEERQRTGMPVGGSGVKKEKKKRRRIEAEVDAEVDEMLNRLEELLSDQDKTK